MRHSDTFDQTHETNWYHPIGFAYYPDGAHGGRTEVMDDSGCEDYCAALLRGDTPSAPCAAGCDSDADGVPDVQYKIDDGWTGTFQSVGLASNTGTDITDFVPGYEVRGPCLPLMLTARQRLLKRMSTSSRSSSSRRRNGARSTTWLS